MIGLRQRKPIDWLVAVVAGVCPYSQPNLRPDGRIELFHVLYISNNNIGAADDVWECDEADETEGSVSLAVSTPPKETPYNVTAIDPDLCGDRTLLKTIKGKSEWVSPAKSNVTELATTQPLPFKTLRTSSIVTYAFT